MRFPVLAALPAIAVLTTGAAVPVTPVILQQSSAWVVDYGSQSCRLISTFGNNGTKLIFESVGPGHLNAMVIGKDVAVPSGSAPWAKLRSSYTVRFLGEPQKATDGTPAIRWTHVPVLALDEHNPPKSLWTADLKPTPRGSMRSAPIDPALRTALSSQREAILAASDAIEVDRSGKAPLILETGTLAAPIHALDQCDADLLKSLGVDPEVQAKLARPPWTDKLLNWFTSDMYPKSAIAAGIESSVTLRLVIDAAGKATNCAAVTSFAAPEFAQAVCAGLAKQAQFEPAELPDGTKVASYYVSEVTFKIAD